MFSGLAGIWPAIAQGVHEQAERGGKLVTAARVALAWLLAQKPWIAPIPGATKLERLVENIGAACVDLTPADLDQIEAAAARITVQANRCPESLERMTGRRATAPARPFRQPSVNIS